MWNSCLSYLLCCGFDDEQVVAEKFPFHQKIFRDRVSNEDGRSWSIFNLWPDFFASARTIPKKVGFPITFFRLGLESWTENVIEWNLGRCVGRIKTDQTGWADRRRSGNPEIQDEVDLHRPLCHAHLLSRLLHHPHRSLPLLETGLKSSLSKLLFCRYERPLLLTFLSFPARAKLLSYIS